MTRYARQRTEVFDDLVDDFFDEYRALRRKRDHFVLIFQLRRAGNVVLVTPMPRLGQTADRTSLLHYLGMSAFRRRVSTSVVPLCLRKQPVFDDG